MESLLRVILLRWQFWETYDAVCQWLSQLACWSIVVIIITILRCAKLLPFFIDSFNLVMHIWVPSESLMKRWFDFSFQTFCINSFKLLALQEPFPEKSADLVSQLHSCVVILSDCIQWLFFGNLILSKFFKLLLEQDLLRVDVFVKFASCADSRFIRLIALFFKFL